MRGVTTHGEQTTAQIPLMMSQAPLKLLSSYSLLRVIRARKLQARLENKERNYLDRRLALGGPLCTYYRILAPNAP